MNKSGMTLLESLLYLSLMSFVCLITAQWVTRLLKQEMSNGISMQHYFDIYSVCDLLNRDLAQAPSAKSDWKVISDCMILWKGNKEDIGWEYCDGKLLRTVGSYDTSKSMWIKKKKALASQELESLKFVLHETQARLFAIDYSINLKKSVMGSRVIQGSVSLINGCVA